MDLGIDQFQGVLEKFSKLPKPYRLATFPAVVALVLGAYAYFFYLPAYADLEVAQTRQFELQRKLNEVRSVASNMSAFEEEIDVLERQLAVALRQLPDSKELPVLLTDLTTLGKNAGLEFKAFRPQTEVARGFYAEVPIEIEFTGRFHEIAAFFDRMARLPRIVNIAELEMEIGEETALGTVLKVKGRATTFRFVEGPRDAAKVRPDGKDGRRGST